MNYYITYDPDSQYYTAECDKHPTLSIMDTSPMEALRRIIVWAEERDTNAG